jgi:hypothetical protein
VNAAGARRVQSCEDRKQRRFAGARSADDRNGLALHDGEFDFAQNDEVAVTALHCLADAARLENRLRTHFRCIAQGTALAILLAWAGAALAVQTLLVFGDSLSAHYGIPEKRSWVSLLGERLKKEKLDYQIVNASISGETTAGGRGRLGKVLADHKPAVVILELGANDGMRGPSRPRNEEEPRRDDRAGAKDRRARAASSARACRQTTVPSTRRPTR